MLYVWLGHANDFPFGIKKDKEREGRGQVLMAETRTISGIEIFSVGTWTDSRGQKITLSESDLDDMVRSFHNGTPAAALKV